jgi:hypothetical protein
MPYKDPDPTDPNVLVGVMIPAEEDTMREMAYAFADEFMQMGYDAARLLAVFKNPFYAGARGAYQALGEEAVRKIIDECVAAWGNIRFSILDSEISIEGSAGEIPNRQSKIPNGGQEG